MSDGTTHTFELRDKVNSQVIRGDVERVVDYMRWVVIPTLWDHKKSAAYEAIADLQQGSYTEARKLLNFLRIELLAVHTLAHPLDDEPLTDVDIEEFVKEGGWVPAGAGVFPRVTLVGPNGEPRHYSVPRRQNG